MRCPKVCCAIPWFKLILLGTASGFRLPLDVGITEYGFWRAAIV